MVRTACQLRGTVFDEVTMANNGFALAEEGMTGHGVQLIEPGRAIEVRYRFAVS